MLKIIGIGDNVCDKYEDINTMYPGGQTLNFTIYSKILGYDSAFIGVFGEDICGKHIIETCKKFNVDISHSRQVKGDNAYVMVNLIEGERRFVASNRGGVLRLNPIKLRDEDLKFISGYDIIHTSDRSYMDSQLKLLSSLKAVISFDISTTWKDDAKTKAICENVDFIFMSGAGLREDEVKKRMITTYGWGTDIVVATRGRKSSLVYDGHRFFASKPKPVKVIDSLGAGDSFAAAFISCFVETIWKDKNISNDEYAKRVNECLDSANTFAGKTCLSLGAFGHGIEII